mgnify:CR=1 FL=1
MKAKKNPSVGFRRSSVTETGTEIAECEVRNPPLQLKCNNRHYLYIYPGGRLDLE